MLLFSGIDRVLGQLFHWLSTADQFAAAANEHLDDVSAQITFVDLISFGHLISPC
jgi:hypothetical protein